MRKGGVFLARCFWAALCCLWMLCAVGQSGAGADVALSSISAVKTWIGITGTSEDTFLTQLLAAVESAFKHLTDRDIEQQTYTDYYCGRGTPVILLREYPVRRASLAGTRTSGSAVVTGISSTTTLQAGMPVVGTGIPVGATISTIDSATQVTLSAAATAASSSTLSFGLAVWEDSDAAWGAGSEDFDDDTFLTEGEDFVLAKDGRGGLAECGRLFRQGGVWQARYEYREGLLYPARKPSTGTVKTIYTAGYSAVPDDIQLALWQTCAILRASRSSGQLLAAENFQEYGYSLRPLAESMMLGSAKQVVARYKRITPRHEVLT